MPHTVRFRLDPDAVAALHALRARLPRDLAAVDEPAVTVAAAASVPPAARAALDAEVRLLVVPSIWLATLGTVAGRPDQLVLAAVVDAELLAVHAAVHDALAGRVKGRWRRTCPVRGSRTACSPPSVRPRRSPRCTPWRRCGRASWGGGQRVRNSSTAAR